MAVVLSELWSVAALRRENTDGTNEYVFPDLMRMRQGELVLSECRHINTSVLFKEATVSNV